MEEFYDRFGDDVVNELVELLNRVDSEYRSELRQQNELNFARFDARLDQRFAELQAQMDRRFAELERRLAVVEGRFALVEEKSDGRFANMERRFSEFEARFDLKLGAVREDMAKLDASVQRGLLMQSRWMLAGWAGVMIAVLLK